MKRLLLFILTFATCVLPEASVNPLSTKWCGNGNFSKSYDDLGLFYETDRCCREHDSCPLVIKSGETKFGLTNVDYFSKSHCDCDEKLYNCLKRVKGFVANTLGYLYFNFDRQTCFKEEYCKTRCLRRSHGKCVQYAKRQKGVKRYQWFDNPYYT